MEVECIFCKIVRGEIQSKKIYEDEFTVSFLDIVPKSRGMCIVIPKKHFTNFNEDFEAAQRVFKSALIVAEKIRRALKPLSVIIASIPSERIPHFHLRVYPVYKDQIPLIENRPIEITPEELESIASSLRNVEVKIEVKKEEKKEVEKEEKKEKKEEKKRSPEETYWIRREISLA